MRKESVVGRVLGILVFLLGTAILVLVAVIAYQLFTSSAPALQVKPGTTTGAAAQLGNSAIWMLYRILLLVVLCIAGSLLAARGLHLYFVATGSQPRGREQASGGE